MSLDKESQFWTAITEKNLAEAFSLLYSGVNPNTAQEGSLLTPLHVACREGDVALAMLLFTKGGLLNVQDTDGRTPLHYAAAGGHGQLVSFLVKAGANVSVQDRTNQMPEELAFHRNHTAIFRLLLAARLGAPPASPTEEGHGKDSLRRIQKSEKEAKKLEKEERKLVEKDDALKEELLQLSTEKTRLEAIPAHLVTKKERAALAQIDRHLSKLDSKHQGYIRDIKNVRRTSFESQDDKGQAWLSYIRA